MINDVPDMLANRLRLLDTGTLSITFRWEYVQQVHQLVDRKGVFLNEAADTRIVI